MARFQREAEVLASLSHPNIAAIHGLEAADGTRALVMELVEGETLADRIARGPIAVDEGLAIAKQIRIKESAVADRANGPARFVIVENWIEELKRQVQPR